ncbi:unnamed protein product [Phyllotreta striolata]|uniref:Coenzyme Q-binding protein COQ10 START domain-containing protein n=1 Tax=Phyllotreta striolata TaxID=444603 RepID=A0A9N9U2M5_PHYSR|nr:unnamed protein product [Phyllotreta striolata]
MSRVKNGIFKLFEPKKRNKEFSTKKLLGYSCEELYSVVADVKHYDKFLPFCKKSTVLAQPPGKIVANLEIGFPPVSDNYTSTVFLSEPHLVQAISCDGRLFDYLESCWCINRGLKSNPQSCIVDYSIKFSFKSVFYSRLAGLFFDSIVWQMQEAFLDEVGRRYGKPSIDTKELKLLNFDK